MMYIPEYPTINRADGGIIGLRGGGYMSPYGMADGGHVPMVLVNGGYIPAYGWGGKIWGAVKKVAPYALGAINPMLGAGAGALISGIENKSLSSALLGGVKGYLGGKALSSGLKAAHLGSLGGVGQEAALKAAGAGGLKGGLGALLRGKGIGAFGGAAFDFLSDPKKVAMLYPQMARLEDQQYRRSPEGQIPSAYTPESGNVVMPQSAGMPAGDVIMPQSAGAGYVAPAQGYAPVRAAGGSIRGRKKGETRGRSKRGKGRVGSRRGARLQGTRKRLLPGVQPVAQQLQESGLVPLTPTGGWTGGPMIPAATPPPTYAPAPAYTPPPPIYAPAPAMPVEAMVPEELPVAQQIQNVIPQTVAATPPPLPPDPVYEEATGYDGGSVARPTEDQRVSSQDTEAVVTGYPAAVGPGQGKVAQTTTGYPEPAAVSPHGGVKISGAVADVPLPSGGVTGGNLWSADTGTAVSPPAPVAQQIQGETFVPSRPVPAPPVGAMPPTPVAEQIQDVIPQTVAAAPPAPVTDVPSSPRTWSVRGPSVQPATVPAAVSPADVPSSPKLVHDPVAQAQSEAHARAEGRMADAWQETLQEMEARGQVTPAVAAPIQQPAVAAPTPPVAQQIQQQVPQTVAAMPPPTPVAAPRREVKSRYEASRGRAGWGDDEEMEGLAPGYRKGGGVYGDRADPDDVPERRRASKGKKSKPKGKAKKSAPRGSAPTGRIQGRTTGPPTRAVGRLQRIGDDSTPLGSSLQEVVPQTMFGMSGADRRDAYTGNLGAYDRSTPRYDPKAAIPQLNPDSPRYDPELVEEVEEARAAESQQQVEQTGTPEFDPGGWWESNVKLPEHEYSSKVHEARLRDEEWQKNQAEEERLEAEQTGGGPAGYQMTGEEHFAEEKEAQENMEATKAAADAATAANVIAQENWTPPPPPGPGAPNPNQAYWDRPQQPQQPQQLAVTLPRPIVPAAPGPIDPSYRAGLMAETASETGGAPIIGYDPFNMPTAGQPSAFDPAYSGMLSRLSEPVKLGAGPAPDGGFGGEPVTPLVVTPPSVIPPPPLPAELKPGTHATVGPAGGYTVGAAQGGSIGPSMMPIESNEEVPVEIIQVVAAAIRGEMPSAEASQILNEIQQLFPGLVEEITNQIRVQRMEEGGADSLVEEGFLPPYPDNGPQGNGVVDDSLAIEASFKDDFEGRLAQGGPLPVRALLAGGEYIVNAGDAGAGRQELIDAAAGIDPRIPPGAAVWDDFVGNINR